MNAQSPKSSDMPNLEVLMTSDVLFELNMVDGKIQADDCGLFQAATPELEYDVWPNDLMVEAMIYVPSTLKSSKVRDEAIVTNEKNILISAIREAKNLTVADDEKLYIDSVPVIGTKADLESLLLSTPFGHCMVQTILPEGHQPRQWCLVEIPAGGVRNDGWLATLFGNNRNVPRN